MAVSIETITQALATVIDPELRAPITELDMVESVDVTDTAVTVSVLLTIVDARPRPLSNGVARL